MTRQEAIEIATKRTGQADPVRFIDLCAELGMLKLDEPKSAAKLEPWSRSEAIKCARAAFTGTDDFVAGLEKMGWQIVEK